jgi:hypothetical protein
MLDPRPVRTDLTDRECSRIIGGLLGSLCGCSDVETVRSAVKWWAETDQAWVWMKAQQSELERLGLSPKRDKK